MRAYWTVANWVKRSPKGYKIWQAEINGLRRYTFTESDLEPHPSDTGYGSLKQCFHRLYQHIETLKECGLRSVPEIFIRFDK